MFSRMFTMCSTIEAKMLCLVLPKPKMHLCYLGQLNAGSLPQPLSLLAYRASCHIWQFSYFYFPQCTYVKEDIHSIQQINYVAKVYILGITERYSYCSFFFFLFYFFSPLINWP